jgi:hypothetical protein
MAETDDVLVELRHRIMGTLKPARPQHQETSEEGPTTTRPVNLERGRGSAAVALHRLAHPGRDGNAVVEDAPASEPINPGRDNGVVLEMSQLIERLSIEMPELLEEIVALVEHRTADLIEREDGASPRPTENVAPAALEQAAPQDDDTGQTAICLHFDKGVLARIDADAKRIGISRTAWLHVAADERLKGRR